MRIFLHTIFLGGVLCAFIAGSFLLWTHTLQARDASPQEEISEAPSLVWGVDYSESQAEYLGLNPEEVYSAIINDLGAENIKIHINWHSIEKTEGVFDFDILDARVHEAERHQVDLILVIGMKTGRWPECHAPQWFLELPAEERRTALLHYVTTMVDRYKDSPALAYWQVENEPVLEFGACPSWYYAEGTSLLQAEVDAVRALDPSRKIIISDSGELSDWTEVADIGDIVGITTYRSNWNGKERTYGKNSYAFLEPEFYAKKAATIRNTYNKSVISIELQAEPWASKPLAEASLEEQAESMNPEFFDENIAFAREAELGTYYFWGVEWWYWMKVTHNQPEIWDKAKVLFAE